MDRASLPLECQPLEMDAQTMAWKELRLSQKSQRKLLSRLYPGSIVGIILQKEYELSKIILGFLLKG